VTKTRRALPGTLAGVIFGLFLATTAMRPGPGQTAQEPPPQDVQKPNYDYMSTFLSRSTHPLGLKEDPAVRRMLGQGSVPWALRAGTRHILD
jgi:hypothetical protein